MAFISNEELNEIRTHADIVDVISSYIKVSPKGKNYVALCPFHDDHNPSMIISKEKQIYSCFRCNISGNVFSFVMNYEHVSFPESVAIVAKKVGITLKNSINTKVVKKNQKEYDIYDFAKKYYHNNILTMEGVKAIEYLHKRGITDEIIKEFNIGLSLKEKDTFYKLCLKKEYDVDTLERLGLINRYDANIYDTFINRIMIPIENLEGDIVAFTGRIYNNETDLAKYYNTKETNIFKKSNILFNYHNAKRYIKELKQLIIVEGNMDAIKLSSKGFKNTIALMGVALSDYQIDIIKKLNVKVILMLDNDEAGEVATIKCGDELIKNNIDLKVVRLNGAKDPDEYLEKYSVKQMQNLIDNALSYLEFKINYLKKGLDLTKAEDISLYINNVLKALNNVDDLTKEVIISKISNDYQIDKEILKKKIGNQKVVNDKKIVQSKAVKKISRYESISHKMIYYMLMDKKYISIYKNRLNYFNDFLLRRLASEITYYSSNNEMNIADFTTYIMKYEDLANLVQIIISENSNTKISDEEFLSCISMLKKMEKRDKLNKLSIEIKNELDINKKQMLVEKFIELKKEV